jgi:hypothetical protein
MQRHATLRLNPTARMVRPYLSSSTIHSLCAAQKEPLAAAKQAPAFPLTPPVLAAAKAAAGARTPPSAGDARPAFRFDSPSPDDIITAAQSGNPTSVFWSTALLTLTHHLPTYLPVTNPPPPLIRPCSLFPGAHSGLRQEARRAAPAGVQVPLPVQLRAAKAGRARPLLGPR